MALTAADLSESARSAAGIPSFYRLARVLGVNDSTVANWRHGRATPDDAMAVRLADMAGLDPAYVVASMHAQRCTDDALRPILQRIADATKAAGAAALAVILSVLFSGTPDAQARASVEENATAGAVSMQWTQGISARFFVARLWAYLKSLPAAPMVVSWDYI